MSWLFFVFKTLQFIDFTINKPVIFFQYWVSRHYLNLVM
jgi:hypothetical protein